MNVEKVLWFPMLRMDFCCLDRRIKGRLSKSQASHCRSNSQFRHKFPRIQGFVQCRSAVVFVSCRQCFTGSRFYFKDG